MRINPFLVLCLVFLVAYSCKNSQEEFQGYDGIDIQRFEAEIQNFRDQNEAEGIQKDVIVFTGSSSIRMWDSLEADMLPYKVVNRGFGGSTLPEILYYFDDLILVHDPELIVLYCGENDLNEEHISPSQTLQFFKRLDEHLQRKLPGTKLLYLSMKPSLDRWDKWEKMTEGNSLIKSYISTKDHLEYLDISSIMLDENYQPDSTIFIEDGLHMNRMGYERWTEVVYPKMKSWQK